MAGQCENQETRLSPVNKSRSVTASQCGSGIRRQRQDPVGNLRSVLDRQMTSKAESSNEVQRGSWVIHRKAETIGWVSDKQGQAKDHLETSLS